MTFRMPYRPAGISPLGFFLITGCYTGLLRPIPGTWGTLPPLLLAAAMFLVGIRPDGSPGAAAVYHLALIALCIAFTLVCARFGDDAEAVFKRKDPGSVTADEVAGGAIPFLFLPSVAIATPTGAAFTLALCFFAFRIFDILKLPPARGLQRIRGGWGIVVDDLIAGVQALIFIQIVARLWPIPF